MLKKQLGKKKTLIYVTAHKEKTSTNFEICLRSLLSDNLADTCAELHIWLHKH